MAAGLSPTFDCATTQSCPELMQRLNHALQAAGLEMTWSRTAGASCEKREDETYVLVRFPPEQRQTWSPWLHLDIKRVDQQIDLHGRFTPHPNLWTAYMLTYLALLCISFFAVMLATGQHLSGSRPTALWVLSFTLTTALVMWWVSQVGQKLAKVQMVRIRELIEQALDLPIQEAS